jgi:hypothetical protein
MSRQAGFSVLSLTLVAVTVLGSLALLLVGQGPSVQGQIGSQKTSQLVAQAHLVAHRVVKCATDYPNGSNGESFHPAYPLDGAVNTLTCPGSGQNLWSGVDGVYAPAPISGFGTWSYDHAQPISISITAIQPGSYTQAIAAAAQKVGASATASADTLTVKIIE